MSINIYNYQNLTTAKRKQLFTRSAADYESVKQEIAPSMAQVKRLGDQPILAKYKARKIPITNLQVGKAEFAGAYQRINPRFLTSLEVARRNLTNVCNAQLKSVKDSSVVNNQGAKVWREWRALTTVGIYAPGGRANYPSSLLMCAVPALIAGCNKLIVCAPPNKQGKLPAELLVTAKKLGIKQVFKVGGPQAIAAMAYGTASIPPVLKIVGPGNQYVNAAKLMVYPTTAIDLPAGPSENLIIADSSANPVWVAADLITDLEHGPDSSGILLTPSRSLANSVRQEVKRLLTTLPTKENILNSLTRYSAILVVKSLAAAVQISNDYAPEHMQIMTRNARKLASQVENAGSVFIGPYSCKAGGDYATGANHVLPTGQAAKLVGPLSVEMFGKYVEFQEVNRSGYQRLATTIETYAQVEELPAHQLSSQTRRTI